VFSAGAEAVTLLFCDAPSELDFRSFSGMGTEPLLSQEHGSRLFKNTNHRTPQATTLVPHQNPVDPVHALHPPRAHPTPAE